MVSHEQHNNGTLTAVVYMANNHITVSRSWPAELWPPLVLSLPFFLTSPSGTTLSTCLPHSSLAGPGA